MEVTKKVDAFWCVKPCILISDGGRSAKVKPV